MKYKQQRRLEGMLDGGPVKGSFQYWTRPLRVCLELVASYLSTGSMWMIPNDPQGVCQCSHKKVPTHVNTGE